MTDDREPREPRYETPPGYFGWPEGDDAVKFLDPETGKLMTGEEWKEWLKTKKSRVIGSGTEEDPYRAPGTPP